MHSRLKTISVLLIILALISPPFVFSELKIFGKEIRGIIGLTIIILLYLERTKFTVSELLIFFILGFVLILEYLSQRSSLNNILAAYAVIFVAYSLFRVLKTNKLSGIIFLQTWMRFSLIISLFAIISFFINQFTDISVFFENSSLFGSSFNPSYDYKISIFGFTVFKKFSLMGVERVSSFFNEPQYAGMFFAFNFLIASKNSELFSKKYYITSLLAGLLTFSITFYLAFIIYLILNLEARKIKIIFFYSFLFLLIIFYSLDVNLNIPDLQLSQTSFLDRMQRNLYALEVVKDATFSKVLFGHGINTYQDYNTNDDLRRGLSSGLLYLLFEFGILISLFILIMFISFSNKDYILIAIGVLYLIAIPWYRYYVSWYAIILCGLDYFNTTSYKKTFSKKNLKDYKTTKNLLS
jgi:hypothetical protein